MKKNVLIALIITTLGLSTLLQAREFDLEFSVGPTVTAGGTSFIESGIGAQVGANFNFFIIRNLSISTGILYQQNKANRTYTATYYDGFFTREEEFTESVTTEYIHLPLVVRGHKYFGKRSRMHVGVGGYYNFNIGSKFEGGLEENTLSNENAGYNEDDYGIVLQAGMEINTFRYNHLTLNLEYQLGLMEHKASTEAQALSVETQKKDLNTTFSSLNFRVGHTF